MLYGPHSQVKWKIQVILYLGQTFWLHSPIDSFHRNELGPGSLSGFLIIDPWFTLPPWVQSWNGGQLESFSCPNSKIMIAFILITQTMCSTLTFTGNIKMLSHIATSLTICFSIEGFDWYEPILIFYQTSWTNMLLTPLLAVLYFLKSAMIATVISISIHPANHYGIRKASHIQKLKLFKVLWIPV